MKLLSHFYYVKNKDPHSASNKEYYLVATKNKSKKIIYYLFTDSDLMVANERAEKNLEDFQPSSFIDFEESKTAIFLAGIIAGIALASFSIWYYVCCFG
jgi:hypothetical protein